MVIVDCQYREQLAVHLGLETAELAELLGISEATVLRDWRAARAWLSLELRRATPDR